MNTKHIEFVCIHCGTKELIPKQVVDDFDLADLEGDLCFPPRFSCDSCHRADMYPLFYKSLRGTTYRFNPETGEFTPPITP